MAEFNIWKCDSCNAQDNWFASGWVTVKKLDYYGEEGKFIKKRRHFCKPECLLAFLKTSEKVND